MPTTEKLLKTHGLWLPEGTHDFTLKTPPPKVGEKFGAGLFAGPNIETMIRYMELPGGGLLMFDLGKLTMADYRQMRDHYQVAISLWILHFMLHQLDWRIENDRQEIADSCEEQLKEHWPRLIGAMSTAFWSGYSPNVLQWDNDSSTGKVVLDKIKDLIPEYCRVNWKEHLGYAPPNGAKPKIYTYDGIAVEGQQTPIPAENTFWWPLLMENGNYYGRKLLRSAFPAYFFSQLMHLFANRYYERFGEPTPIGRYPSDTNVPDPSNTGGTITSRDAMANIVQSLRNRSVVTLPSDREMVTTVAGNQSARGYEWDIEFLESQMRGADWERYMHRLDEEISLALFTPVLMYRTSDIGSYNLGDVHFRLFLTMLNAIAGDMKLHIDRYILDRMVDINYGVNAPRSRWVPRRLGKDVPETQRAIAQALIAGQFAIPELTEFSESIGMEFTKVTAGDQAPPDPTAIATAKARAQQVPAGGRASSGAPTARNTPLPSSRPSGAALNQAAFEVAQKMTQRVHGQLRRAAAASDPLETVDLDPGHRRQLMQVGCAEDAVDQFFTVFRAWWEETRSLDLTLDQLISRTQRVLVGSVEAMG